MSSVAAVNANMTPRKTTFIILAATSCIVTVQQQKRSGALFGVANLKKVLGLHFKHHDAGEDARAAAEVTLKAEASMGRKIMLLNDSQQLVFDFQ